MIITQRKYIVSIILILTLVFTTSCTKDDTEKPIEKVPVYGEKIEATDYSDEKNWMPIPETDKETDVFVLYPTTYSAGEDGAKVADIKDSGMREGALAFFNDKASAFEDSGNMYAPYYRQLDAGWFLTLPKEEQSQYISGVPATDVLAAFDYYIENYNDDKPFILVGHSQGATMVKELLFKYMKDNPQVYERMIAAYVIGYSVTAQDLDNNPHLKFAEGESDTGVIISYNTVSPDVDVTKLSTWQEGSIAINPISWTRTEEKAEDSESRGSYINKGEGPEKIEGLADAAVDVEKGVVVCSSITGDQIEEYSISGKNRDIFPLGSYHGYDIPFYYFDLSYNAELRTAKYLINAVDYVDAVNEE